MSKARANRKAMRKLREYALMLLDNKITMNWSKKMLVDCYRDKRQKQKEIEGLKDKIVYLQTHNELLQAKIDFIEGARKK